jgi:hypothetical protein
MTCSGAALALIVKCGVLFEVGTEFLNAIQASFGFCERCSTDCRQRGRDIKEGSAASTRAESRNQAKAEKQGHGTYEHLLIRLVSLRTQTKEFWEPLGRPLSFKVNRDQ